MAKADKTLYDIFISHSATDGALAASLAASFRSAGLEAFVSGDVADDVDPSDITREAIAECIAIVVIVSRPELPPSMIVEIGAAQAWEKPIYAVVTDPASLRVPSWLSRA